MGTLTLDRLPLPPDLQVSAPRTEQEDTFVGLIEARIVAAEAAEEKLAAFEHYNEELRTELDDICNAVDSLGDELGTMELTSEEFTDCIEKVGSLIDQMLEREHERATETIPLMEQLSAERATLNARAARLGARVGKLRQPLRQLLLIWKGILDRLEQCMLSELETYRDARARIERRRADLINRKEGAGPVFDSGDEAVVYLRSSRP